MYHTFNTIAQLHNIERFNCKSKHECIGMMNDDCRHGIDRNFIVSVVLISKSVSCLLMLCVNTQSHDQRLQMSFNRNIVCFSWCG